MEFEKVSLNSPELCNGRASENGKPEHGGGAKIIRDPLFFSLR